LSLYGTIFSWFIMLIFLVSILWLQGHSYMRHSQLFMFLILYLLQFYFRCRIWQMFLLQSYSFRRGSYSSTIFSLSFGPSKQLPDILAATSSSGSIHLFTLGFASHPRWEFNLKYSRLANFPKCWTTLLMYTSQHVT